MSAQAEVKPAQSHNLPSQSIENTVTTDTLDHLAIQTVRRATREAALHAVAACAVRVVYGLQVNQEKISDIRPQIVRSITGLEPKEAAKAQRRAYDFASYGCKVATDLDNGEWNIHDFKNPEDAVNDVLTRLKGAYGSMDALTAHYGKGKGSRKATSGDPLKAVTKAFAKADDPQMLAQQVLRVAAIYLARHGHDFDTEQAKQLHKAARAARGLYQPWIALHGGGHPLRVGDGLAGDRCDHRPRDREDGGEVQCPAPPGGASHGGAG